MNESEIIAGREALLEAAIRRFSSDSTVVGVFLAGSLATGNHDAYSDIDLRVIVKTANHPWFVGHRCEFPKLWPGFLFNEWLPATQHCVSHFRSFNKIDIFYCDEAAIEPSPWLNLPIVVIHDPSGLIASLLEASRAIDFAVSECDVDGSISKGLAAIHETYRRARRGELFYAQTLMDELRQHIMQADDWLHDRTPKTTLHSKFDQRCSEDVRTVLTNSYCRHDARAILQSLGVSAALYREQIGALHGKFGLSRQRQADFDTTDIILRELTTLG